MRFPDCRVGAAALTAVALSVQPATAQVTAQEIWDEWQEISIGMGQTLTVESEQRAGGTLTVTGLVSEMELPDGSFSGRLDRLVLTEQGDGTVRITMSEEYPLALTVVAPEGETAQIDMMLRQSGLEMIASRDGGETRYDYSAAEMTVVMDAIEAENEDFPIDVEVSLSGLEGLYLLGAGDGPDRIVTSDLSAGALAIAMAVADPEGSGDVIDLIGTMSDIVSTSTGTLSSFAAMAGTASLGTPGVTSEGSVGYGPARYEITGEDENGPFAITATTAGGGLDFALDDGVMAYGGQSSDIAVAISGAQIPVPELGFTMAENAWEVSGPVGVGETPQDFGMLLRLRDLTIDDALWSMFDPTGAIPRDPATLVLDLAGQGNWLIDVTDPALDPMEIDGAVGELAALSVNEMRLDLAGAELTGNGAFTFDNDDLDTFDGLPRPEGAMDFTLVGANGLIDTLVTMGLLPQDQAMGARMMLGLFARPGDGDDTLVSRIEVTPEGSVFANGQQLR